MKVERRFRRCTDIKCPLFLIKMGIPFGPFWPFLIGCMVSADYWLTDCPELRRTTQPSTIGSRARILHFLQHWWFICKTCKTKKIAFPVTIRTVGLESDCFHQHCFWTRWWPGVIIVCIVMDACHQQLVTCVIIGFIKYWGVCLCWGWIEKKKNSIKIYFLLSFSKIEIHSSVYEGLMMIFTIIPAVIMEISVTCSFLSCWSHKLE